MEVEKETPIWYAMRATYRRETDAMRLLAKENLGCFVPMQYKISIKKGKKVYFYDNGIRNAVISNFAPLELRTDVGALWENLMVSERVKRNAYTSSFANLYFWRTHEQQEIDLIEEEDGILRAYEFKWNTKAKAKMPKSFAENYQNSIYEVITPDHFWSFLR